MQGLQACKYLCAGTYIVHMSQYVAVRKDVFNPFSIGLRDAYTTPLRELGCTIQVLCYITFIYACMQVSPTRLN